MGALISAGAMCRCSFGSAPCALNVPADNRTPAGGVPAATIMDGGPVNLPTFGMCSSPSNPAVSSASPPGAIIPKPCQPAITGSWVPGCESVMIGNAPALTDNSKAMCGWAGIIEFAAPGQQTVKVP